MVHLYGKIVFTKALFSICNYSMETNCRVTNENKIFELTLLTLTTVIPERAQIIFLNSLDLRTAVIKVSSVK